MSERAGQPATSDVLGGTSWEIESIGGEPVLPDVPLPVSFGHDGRMTGSTGVNSLTTSYSVNAEYVTIGPLATTRRAGTPQQMEQEHRVVGALAGMCAYRLTPTHLTIEGPYGPVEMRSATAAPSTTGPAPVALRGTVRYDGPAAMPFGAVVAVRVIRPDGSVVAEQRQVASGEVPVAFVVDVEAYDPDARYGAVASIVVGDEVRWRSATPVAVLGPAGTTVDLVVEAVE